MTKTSVFYIKQIEYIKRNYDKVFLSFLFYFVAIFDKKEIYNVCICNSQHRSTYHIIIKKCKVCKQNFSFCILNVIESLSMCYERHLASKIVTQSVWATEWLVKRVRGSSTLATRRTSVIFILRQLYTFVLTSTETCPHRKVKWIVTMYKRKRYRTSLFGLNLRIVDLTSSQRNLHINQLGHNI